MSSSPPFHLRLLHSSPPRVGPILKWGLKSSISFPPPPSPLLPPKGGSYPKNSEFTKTRKSRTANASLSKAHWEMLVRKVRSSKARRGEPKTKVPARRTVENSDFRCSWTIFEGSPDVTVPSRNPISDAHIVRNCWRQMRFADCLCIFLGNFWSSFWDFLNASKKRPWRRGLENWDDFFYQKTSFFCFRF